MRKRDRRALGSYMRKIADFMELRDWHLDLSHDPPEYDDAYATCEPIYGQKRAVFRFAVDFRERDLEGQRHTVVHELVHLHLAALTSQVECDVSEIVGRPVDSVFWKGARRNLEYAVDGLTRAIAKHMPVIEWPESKDKP